MKKALAYLVVIIGAAVLVFVGICVLWSVGFVGALAVGGLINFFTAVSVVSNAVIFANYLVGVRILEIFLVGVFQWARGGVE